MRPVLLTLGLLSLAFAVACGDDSPPPGGNDTGLDAAFPDLGIPRDAAILDGGGFADATADGGTPPADGSVDSGIPPADSGTDAGTNPSDGSVDAGTDAGPTLSDQDNDFISDVDEGDGQVDTDNDNTPDSADSDSDGDGISDADEAGDTDLNTPPVDTDNDNTPDFRDLDSDDDGIPDAVEGTGDPDNDNIPNFQDLDSDGDGILDADEGTGDADNDNIPDYLDDDTDGDGIPDLVEGTGDPDNDNIPNYLDDDSDGDGIPDSVEGTVDPDGDQTPAFLDLDSDGDGIDDMTEGTADPDGDNRGNWIDRDSDGDSISDLQEGTADPDNDNAPNYLDGDSDNDTLTDAQEAGDTSLNTPPVDSDSDSTPDFLDLDSDDDTISDTEEGLVDTDNDNIPDFLDIDSDSDAIFDSIEAGDANLGTAAVDSDNDNTPDFRDDDSDGDTIADVTETSDDADNDNTPNYLDDDSDADGWTDAVEAGDADIQTFPFDTDADGTPDFLDVDSDGDGLADSVEPGCPAGPDRLTEDSDADGFVDPGEIAFGSDPCDGGSVIDDFYFILPPGGPGDNAPLVFSDTGLDRVDVAINMDTTGSMGGEIANLQASLSTDIIPGVDTVIPDTSFAVSSFEDFPVEPFGCDAPGSVNCPASNGDLPFRLGTRVTSDAAAAQTAVNALALQLGYDFPESGLEALYQIATGAGLAWNGGSVPAFDPNANRIAGVADGDIGGVGFRTNSLPIVVHVTDAFTHLPADYALVDPQITSSTPDETEAALASIGARVVTIANSRLPDDVPDQICTGNTAQVMARLDRPVGTDADWFRLDGATVGDIVTAETSAFRVGASVDTTIALFDATGQIAFNDDIAPNVFDSRVSAALTGTPPFYVAVSSFGDADFNGTGGTSADLYFLDVDVDGVEYTTSTTECRLDDGNTRPQATSMVAITGAAQPASVTTCLTACEDVLEPFTLPYGMSRNTGASVPPCAWDEFGAGRPVTCGANECCTGVDGDGVPSNYLGQCPLTFEVDDDGTGLGDTVVAAIEALARFSTFTITTVARTDPNANIDTTCFLESIIPTSATPPNQCAPQPVAVDLFAPSPELDSWENVVPGTVLEFDVSAINLDANTGQPCAPALPDPQLFRAFIDVVADGVTVVDTRDVIIIVPPIPPENEN